ncbi:MAG: DUF5678 domain-containing protein [Nanoarchaeota archaeon]
MSDMSLELKNFQEDFIFFQSNQDNFRQQFLNKFVVIKNKNVLLSGNSIEELREKLEKEKLNPSEMVIEFVPEKETIMIL